MFFYCIVTFIDLSIVTTLWSRSWLIWSWCPSGLLTVFILYQKLVQYMLWIYTPQYIHCLIKSSYTATRTFLRSRTNVEDKTWGSGFSGFDDRALCWSHTFSRSNLVKLCLHEHLFCDDEKCRVGTGLGLLFTVKGSCKATAYKFILYN